MPAIRIYRLRHARNTNIPPPLHPPSCRPPDFVECATQGCTHFLQVEDSGKIEVSLEWGRPALHL
eukprot:3419829-Pyramimonas_sp.AAC.1